MGKGKETRAVPVTGIFQSPSFSAAITVGGFVFISGTVALDQNKNLVGKDDFRRQAEFIFQTLERILHSAGSSINGLIRATIFITDEKNYAALNEIWDKYVARCNPLPARVTVVSKLVLPQLLIEVEGIATVLKPVDPGNS